MNWTTQIDNYCERVDFTFWAEPLNAVSNAAFLLAALYVWAVLGGKRDPGARLLVGILVAIGIGSFLFHTYATRWALQADVIPITVFIVAYVYLSTRRILGLPLWAGIVAVLAFFPYSWAGTEVTRDLVGRLNGSAHYVPVPVLILAYAAIMAFRDPVTARGLAIGAGILIVSLVFRTIDAAVCAGVPLGTHFLWHTLNGIMLGWMILVLHQHQPGHRPAPR